MSRQLMPLHTGDRFVDKNGAVWEVIRVVPFGKVELFNRAACRFLDLHSLRLRSGIASGAYSRLESSNG